MEYNEIDNLLELAKQFHKAWNDFDMRLTDFEVWKSNYEEEEDYEDMLGQFESELEDAANELIESYSKISKKLCAQNVSLVHGKQKKTSKGYY